MPPDVAPLFHVDFALGPAQHDHLLHPLGLGQGQVGVRLQRHHLAASPRPVLGDDDVGGGVVDATGEGVG